METTLTSAPAPALTLYCCNICKTKPDQLSHHKSHLTTQKHIFKKKCFENCINTSFILNRGLILQHNTGEKDKLRIVYLAIINFDHCLLNRAFISLEKIA